MANSVVGTYKTLSAAEAAVRQLGASEFPIEQVSIVSNGLESEKEIRGFVTRGDVAKSGATTGAWVGGLFGILLGAAFLWVPEVGPLVVAGPLAAALLGGVEGAALGAGTGGLLGVLTAWGVNDHHILKYEEKVKAGAYLVIAHGGAKDVTEAYRVLHATSPAALDRHDEAKLHLPPKAHVYGSDAYIGRATELIIHPVRKRVTHLVVKADGLGGEARLVPIEDVKDALQNRIDLKTSKDQFKRYSAFTEARYVHIDVPAYLDYGGWNGMGWPYVSSVERAYVDVSELVPEGEFALKRGMRVDALDGHVGRIDEVVIEPENGTIAQLVMRQGHVFGEQDIVIPVTKIKKLEPERVLLNLRKHDVEALVHRSAYQLYERA